MRGNQDFQGAMFSYISLEERVPQTHPLRKLRAVVESAGALLLPGQTGVDAALLRMANGQYGLCIDCGDEIAPARLQLAPESSRCIACASQQERAHGLGKPPTM